MTIKGILGGWRAAIANHRVNQQSQGRGSNPSLEQVKSGAVLSRLTPIEGFANPFNGSFEVQLSKWNFADPPVSGTAGWNYDPEIGKIWANSDVAGENDF
jgi:hypothetical protein